LVLAELQRLTATIPYSAPLHLLLAEEGHHLTVWRLETAALAVAAPHFKPRIPTILLAAAETRQARHHHKATMEAQAALSSTSTLAAEAAVRRLLAATETAQAVLRVTVVQVLHRPFLAVALPTQEAVAAVHFRRVRREQGEQAVAQMGQLVEPRQTRRLIPEAAVAVVRQAAAQAAQAAPASSSSSTTSALPQSSPSSHRRSGLHLRVR
jgi:hypothetical protein